MTWFASGACCTWCDRIQKWVVVFGYTDTQGVWDVRLCDYHKTMVESNDGRISRIFAPATRQEQESGADRWADMWEINAI